MSIDHLVELLRARGFRTRILENSDEYQEVRICSGRLRFFRWHGYDHNRKGPEWSRWRMHDINTDRRVIVSPFSKLWPYRLQQWWQSEQIEAVHA